MNTAVSVASLASASAAPSIAAESITEPDPTFAAIERHKAVRTEIDGLIDPSDDVVDSWVDIEDDRLVDLLMSRPTTTTGLAALLRYLAAHCKRDDHGLFARYYPHTRIRQAADQLLPALADRIEALAVRS